MKEDKIELMAEFFDKRIDHYDGHMLNVIPDAINFYKAVSKPINKTGKNLEILDLGSGTGLEIEYMFVKAPNAKIYCVDLSKQMLNKLKEKHSSRLKNLKLLNESYLKYKFKKEKFDYIVSVETMHHLTFESKLKLYGKIKKSLKKSGCYIEGDFFVDNLKEKKLLDKYLTLKKANPKITDGRFHIDIPLSLFTQKKVLKKAGFESVSIVWNKSAAVIVAK
ncbi:MAG: methyltransferase domain-containing protein [Patescibacteria group bacterium]